MQVPFISCAKRAGLHDVATLYDLHLDVFQSFCRSAGNTWSRYTASSSSNRHEMNQFRMKTVNQSGIFVSFLDWHMFGKLFLRQAGVNAEWTFVPRNGRHD
ncbi:hypothetical protein GQ600_15025 [Phytophthora cactorum]|nr:hypothetical protein GQ600_15025 [Phytophthora cactorum]